MTVYRPKSLQFKVSFVVTLRKLKKIHRDVHVTQTTLPFRYDVKHSCDEMTRRIFFFQFLQFFPEIK